MALERAGWRNKARPLRLENLQHRPVPLVRMPALPEDGALVLEPCVQLRQRLEPPPRLEQPVADEAHLVLDLPLLPARRPRAGDRLHEMMAAHGQEPGVPSPVLAREHRVHRRPHVVVDAPRASTAEKRERLLVRVEQHLLALPMLRPDIGHPAVAKTDVRDLQPDQLAPDDRVLVAPVELVGLARIEDQRDMRLRRRPGLPTLPPPRRMATHGVVAARVAQGLQILENPHQRHLLALRTRRVPVQHPIELRFPRPDLRTRLRPPLVDELRRARTDNLPDSLPG